MQHAVEHVAGFPLHLHPSRPVPARAELGTGKVLAVDGEFKGVAGEE